MAILVHFLLNTALAGIEYIMLHKVKLFDSQAWQDWVTLNYNRRWVETREQMMDRIDGEINPRVPSPDTFPCTIVYQYCYNLKFEIEYVFVY